MVDIALAPPVGESRTAALRDQLRAWLVQPALTQLVELWGGHAPSNTVPLGELATYLAEFSSVWDYRGRQRERSDVQTLDAGGRARWELIDDERVLANRASVLNAVRMLGLVRARQPRRREVEFVLVLGGARLSNLLRTRRAAQLMATRRLKARAVVLLGAFRELLPGERQATDTYAPGAATEFDLFVRAAERELAVDTRSPKVLEGHESGSAPETRWAVWDLGTSVPASGASVYVVAAPSSDSTRRANSADAYAFFHRQFQPPTGTSCLAVTSQIYVPYQHMEAVRTLATAFDLNLETVGFPNGWAGRLHGLASPTNYLQEIRSALLAAMRLEQSLELRLGGDGPRRA